jgi:sulfide:quinone oxidoreductase
MNRVIIAGAGFGGIGTAVALRRQMDASRLEIVLIERRDDFVMGLRKTWAALGMEPLDAGRRSLRDIGGVRLEIGEITLVDGADRAVEVNGRRYDGDALILALGASQLLDAVPGMAEFGINVWDRPGAETAWSRLEALSGGRLVIGIFGLPYTCPPAPFELALLCRDRLPPSVDVAVFSPAPLALPVVGAAESAKVERLLSDRRIEFLPGRQATRVFERSVGFADGSEQPFDLLLYVPPHRIPTILVASGMAEPDGWLKPDPRTLELAVPGVYAIGDCTAITLANGLPLPKAGIFAHAQGEVVAARIAARLRDREPDATFGGDGYCFIETGAGMAAKAEGRFLADPVDVHITEPTAMALAEKREFERVRLADWFGRRTA